jgi:polyphenol oxidase
LQQSFYIFPDWPALKNVHAICTTKLHGYSEGPYASFNLAAHVDDNPLHVAANRNKLLQELQLPNEPIWLSQTHSNSVLNVDSFWQNPNEDERIADAAFSNTSNNVLAILTADCLPILITNTTGNCVAAIHCGWRGLANNIIENTVNNLKTSPQELLVWLGPAIGPLHFSVGPDVFDIFTKENAAAKQAFTSVQTQKEMPPSWLLNIYTIARQRLEKLGIKHTRIYGGEFCSFSQQELFFSYRRDHKITGRMASLIWFTPFKNEF